MQCRIYQWSTWATTSSLFWVEVAHGVATEQIGSVTSFQVQSHHILKPKLPSLLQDDRMLHTAVILMYLSPSYRITNRGAGVIFDTGLHAYWYYAVHHSDICGRRQVILNTRLSHQYYSLICWHVQSVSGCWMWILVILINVCIQWISCMDPISTRVHCFFSKEC